MDIEALGIRLPHEGGMVVFSGGGVAVAHPGTDQLQAPHSTTSLVPPGPSFANMLRRMVSVNTHSKTSNIMKTLKSDKIFELRTSFIRIKRHS